VSLQDRPQFRGNSREFVAELDARVAGLSRLAQARFQTGLGAQ
jgi:hypothetical protein